MIHNNIIMALVLCLLIYLLFLSLSLPITREPTLVAIIHQIVHLKSQIQTFTIIGENLKSVVATCNFPFGISW